MKFDNGSIGMLLFYIAGGIIMLTMAILVLIAKKKELEFGT